MEPPRSIFSTPLLLQIGNNGQCEVGRGRSTMIHVLRLALAVVNNLEDGVTDALRMIFQTKMSQKKDPRKDHAGWVGQVLALDILPHMSAALFSRGKAWRGQR